MNPTSEWLRVHLWSSPIIAIVRGDAVRDPQGLARTLIDAAVPTIEVTFTTPGTVMLVEQMAAVDGAVVGVGTVLSDQQVRDASAAGARFAVTPARVAEVEAACHDVALPLITGAMTPTEIHQAAQAADLVKVFPARGLGPGFVSDVLAPFPGLALVPSGGIGLDDVGAYLAAGAWAVGLGALAPREALGAGDHGVVDRLARRAVASADAGRKRSG